MTTRWKLTVEYNGAPYSGWQRQEPGIPSVQEEIEKALLAFCQKNITVHVAGRTDAGVHAKGQVCHFDLDYGDRALDGFGVMKALNALLRPQPISILAAQEVSNDFHARFDATHKVYAYRILNRSGPPALDRDQVWHIHSDLDLEAMGDGAQYLLGHHDFSSFRDSGCQAKHPMRTLRSLRFAEVPADTSGGRYVIMMAEARSFLHHQVRNMIGTLVQVGQGKRKAEDIKEILEAKDRRAAGPTAPADGLTLIRVDYDGPKAQNEEEDG